MAQAQATHAVVSAAWAYYAFSYGLLVAFVASLLPLLLGLVLSAFASSASPGWPVSLQLAAVLAGSFALGGSTVLGLVLSCVPLVAERSQVRSPFRSDAPALSVGAYAVNVVRSLAWLPYAVSEGDLATLVRSVTSAAAAAVVLLLLLRHRRPGRAASRRRLRC